jgi:hypothetical protein
MMHIRRAVACLDESAASFRRVENPSDDDLRLDKRYAAVDVVVVDPAIIADGYNVFRLGGFLIVVVVSDRLRQAVERAGLTGVEFERACR